MKNFDTYYVIVFSISLLLILLTLMQYKEYPEYFKSSPQSCVKVQPHQKHNVLRCEPNCHAFLSEERGQEQ